MKRILLAVLMIAATAMWADDLVEAAKAAKAKRKKSTTKVITNADVKKAKAKLIEKKDGELPHVEPLPDESSLQKHEREKKESAAADLKLAAAKATVARFEKELAAVEQKYYEEDDLDRRDKELVRRFNDTKMKLEAATSELDLLSPAAEAAPAQQ
jgi:hypothetical protein